MLYVGSSGGRSPQDLYRPALVFAAAIAASKKGYEAKVALLGDAVFVLDRGINDRKPSPGKRPTLKELIEEAAERHIEIRY
jgi:predicted peroxiredoxin